MFGEDLDTALEEAWVYGTVKDFEYILLNKQYDYIDLTTILSKAAQKQLLVILTEEVNDGKETKPCNCI
jgi:hypothetical protein